MENLNKMLRILTLYNGCTVRKMPQARGSKAKFQAKSTSITKFMMFFLKLWEQCRRSGDAAAFPRKDFVGSN